MEVINIIHQNLKTLIGSLLKFMLCRVILTLAGQKNTRHYMDTHNLLHQSKVLSSADHTLFPCGKKENNNKTYKNEQKP